MITSYHVETFCWLSTLSGETIDNFLEGFPTVGREQVVGFLEEARDKIVAGAS
jgi:uncharacterized protein (DUF433 family)